jgi:aminopeptidase N
LHRERNTLPIWSFIEPKLGTHEAARALVPKAIRFLERRFGPYPFNSAGIVVKDTDVDYALETQNRPVFDEDEGDTVNDLTNVHEWGHQWYGDSVTLSDWGDIWLNEGFAEYAAWLGTLLTAGRARQSSSGRRTTILKQHGHPYPLA